MAKEGLVVGDSNVFADLGRSRLTEALAKAELARKFGAAVSYPRPEIC
jgi:hypothetical protein